MREILDKLRKELDGLEHEFRVELPKEIKTAVAMGDLRENAEYHAALERQAFVRARIGQLRERLGALSAIDLSQVPRDRSSTARDAARMARSRSPSAVGLKDEKALAKAEKLGKKKAAKLAKFGRIESDRRVITKRPKHLNSGKRKMGKTDRR